MSEWKNLGEVGEDGKIILKSDLNLRDLRL
jgi:hypothetical protein